MVVCGNRHPPPLTIPNIANIHILLILLIVLGNALTCQRCEYTSQFPTEKQKCDPNITKVCDKNIEYCFTGKYTDSSGTVKVIRGCDEDYLKLTFCPDAEKTCSVFTKSSNLKACAGACCRTDKCNEFTPSGSSATGIIVSKFTLILMVIAGLVA